MTAATAAAASGRPQPRPALLPVAAVIPNPANPRRHLGDVTELAQSIRELGVLSPLLVEHKATGGFLLHAGHRRLAAAKLAGLARVPVLIIEDQLPDEALLVALAENLHRADLRPMEEAAAARDLLDMLGSVEEVARRIGKSTAWVRDRLVLLELPADAQRLVATRQVTLQQGTELGRQVRRQSRGAVVTSRVPPHFTTAHPLAPAARERCDEAGHATLGRLGKVACGWCWEAVIRADSTPAIGDAVLERRRG